MGVTLRILLWYLYALWLGTFMDYVIKVWWNYLVRKRLLELHSKAELMCSSGLEALRFPNWFEWLFTPFCVEPVNSVCFVFVCPLGHVHLSSWYRINSALLFVNLNFICALYCCVFISLFLFKTDKSQSSHFHQLFQILRAMGHSWADR